MLERPKDSFPKVDPILLTHAFAIAKEVEATAIFVYYDALPKDFEVADPDVANRIYYLTRSSPESGEQPELGSKFIQVPGIALTRMGLIKMAVLLSLARGILKTGQRVVCLSGPSSPQNLDTLLVLDVGKELEVFLSTEKEGLTAEGLMPAVLERVIRIAAHLAIEGREGKPVGVLFVLGDIERVLSLSRQLILNPFRGYPEDERNILNPGLEETVKELATIDGAFLIRCDGVVESAGTYLKTGASGEQDLPQGLGARHQAAASITSVSEAIAITVSESTGTVTVFRNGQIIMAIKRPHRGRTGGVVEG